jgi:predicted ester cyclase
LVNAQDAAKLKSMAEAEVIVSDNRIVMRWTYSGTHSGAENEAMAGKKVTNSGISVVHVADGKMVEEWAAWDNLHTMTQLGMTVVPADAAKTD